MASFGFTGDPGSLQLQERDGSGRAPATRASRMICRAALETWGGLSSRPYVKVSINQKKE